MKGMRNGQLIDLTEAEMQSLQDEKVEYDLTVLPVDVRAQRDHLLASTDWTALGDTTMSSAMAAYRQALRDLPAQEGFPHAVTWPSKP